MALSLQDILARAYDLDQAQHDAAGAVGETNLAMEADPALASAVGKEQERLGRLIAARESGDHVSMVLYRILTQALKRDVQP